MTFIGQLISRYFHITTIATRDRTAVIIVELLCLSIRQQIKENKKKIKKRNAYTQQEKKLEMNAIL